MPRSQAALQSVDTSTPCPCGNPAGYAKCCRLLHQGAPADSAEALMRSRYSAYVLRLEDYLLNSWHPDTRPASLRLAAQQPAPTWLGLKIRAHAQDDADHATVEFIARYRVGGGRAQRLHERSRFVREDGHWFYLDGDMLTA
jgi:SEC-C motif-containing protein